MWHVFFVILVYYIIINGGSLTHKSLVFKW